MLKNDERTLCTVMKGIAIAGIVMHNYLHKVGYAPENEHTFNIDNGLIFWNSISTNTPIHAIGDIISFIGWIGVCAFIFLSGYGLERKYRSSEIVVSNFVLRQWTKLFTLMLAGALFFIIFKWNGGKSLEYIVSLTMFGNTINHYVHPCGVYWYFGLAFELYLFWLLIRKSGTKLLLAILLILLALQLPLLNFPSLCYHKYNLLGWGHIFIFGMIVARADLLSRLQLGWKTALALTLLGTLLVILCNFNKHTWLLLLPLLAFVTIWAAAQLISRWSLIGKVGLWLGRLSAFLFAMHPVVRELILTYTPDEMNRAVRFAIYLGCTVLLTILFAKVYRKITSSYRYSSAR